MDPNIIMVGCYRSIVIPKFQSIVSKFTHELNVSLPEGELNLSSLQNDKQEDELTIDKQVEELRTDSGLEKDLMTLTH